MAFQISPGVNVSEIDLTTVVPNVSTTAGAFAGILNWGPVGVRTLVDSEATLAAKFGVPTDANYETFFTAANFLAYGNNLYLVRVIDGANNAYANTGTVTGFAIKNEDDFANTTVTANVTYLAKYPSSLGNSLKVSVCDSANAYEETVSVNTFTASFTNVTSFAVQSNTGSNTLTVSIQANTAGVANSAAQTLVTYLAVGDVLEIGNTTLGLQTVSVTAVSTSNSETSNSGTYTTTATVSLSLPILLPANVNQTTVKSRWEYANLVDKAPRTSNFLATKGYTAVDEMHVVVVDKNGLFSGTAGTVLEVFRGLSRATDAKTDDGSTNYYKTVLNNTSQYIWAITDRSGAASAAAASVASSTNRSPYTVTLAGGGDGNGEANCSLSALTGGYDLFKNPQDVDVSLVLLGKARGVTAETTSPSSSSANYSTIANYVIGNIAEYRKDCVAFISPAKPDSVVQTTGGDAVTNMVAFRNNLSTATSYGVLDSGYKQMYDKYNDVRRWVPMNGDTAGTCVRTDTNRDPWFSPAGLQRGQIKNVIRLAKNPGPAEREVLYKSDINPIVTFDGEGTILYGDKTLLGRPSAFDRINVRRLFITLEKAIAIAAKSSLFEFNDEYTRALFKNLVEPFLFDVKGRRGIIDFKVVCDETNNTSQVLDSNQFIGDIYIKPQHSINYIQLNFVAVRSGVDFSEIVGSV
jgi:hypothetical protein